MGKRSTFERRAQDFYPTPVEAVGPLLPHLRPRSRFMEPCAGDGALIDHLVAAGHLCVFAGDIEPRRDDIWARDALTDAWPPAYSAVYITNPPWDRRVLHPLIERLSDRAPAWLLFDADWVHTLQAAPYLPRLRKIVSVGRVRWIPGTPHDGKDNCAWHLFTGPDLMSPAQFYGRGVEA